MERPRRDCEADRALARSAALGDEDAWRRIYESTCNGLMALLSYQVGDRDEAMDLLQETYVQAYRSLAGYRGDAPLEAWLRVIALRKAIDWRRGPLRRLRRTVRLTEKTSPAIDQEPRLRTDAERRSLEAALRTLSPQQRAALLLHEMEGWSYKEIATLLGCKESTARVHHTRAAQKLRRSLDRGAPGLRTEARGETQ